MAEGAKAPVYVEGLPHSGGKRVEIRKSAYRGNGKTALYGVMVDEGGEKDFAVFSVNLPAEASKLGAGQTYMKNWSENAGMLEVLQKAGSWGRRCSRFRLGSARPKRFRFSSEAPPSGS